MGTEAECPTLFFGGLEVCYLLVGGWRWHGAKLCLGPAEIQQLPVAYIYTNPIRMVIFTSVA